ncbi:MAG TPA: NADH-quinone oxidoreductase subunit J [Solirubrobacteraceae bacterium]|jgi:NADH:ubiquinone oxidoreductase subunit 6 (subunit J)|nr:NADH-quinone oxidoreductase subunit J [Solirubrobacteraceae bacterium]
MSAVLFFIAAIGAIAGAIGVVMLRNPFYNVLALVCHLIALAALFLLLRAEFVAAGQVVVYAGAVMVLYIFVVAYIGGADEPMHRHGGALKVLGPVFGLALAVELCIAMLGTALKGISSKGAPYVFGFGTPKHIGTLFLTTYLFPFEMASLLLLVAAIGAVVLARRRRGLEGDEEETVISIQRPVFTGTMHESTGIRAGGGTVSEEEWERQHEPVGSQAAGRRDDRDGRAEGGW